MQTFACPVCSQTVYFRNTVCSCGHPLVFDPAAQAMVSGAEPCANREAIWCNWIADASGLCHSCAMTDIVPDLATPDNREDWANSETAKRWVLANLARWGWTDTADTGPQPRFRFLSEQTSDGAAPVVMGHAEGVITINVSEASASVRAERQEEFGELYRTMIGHIRHEIAHYLFERLAHQSEFLGEFRALFGDEREDYGAALQRHHANPQEPGQTHVTSYATAHPHEDWAETVSHLLHLVDLLDSAIAVGLSLPKRPEAGHGAYEVADTKELLDRAIEVSLALNHVNRALDLPDLYPFVLTPAVREKLAFAHRMLRQGPTS